MKDLNVLISYAFWSDKWKDRPLIKSKRSDIFLDSGAYSVFTGKAKITIDEYIYFLKHHKHLFWRYINLDVIGDAEQSEYNFEKMRAAGLEPAPVFTRANDISSSEREKKLEAMCETSDFICIGGLVRDIKKKSTRDYLFKVCNYLTKKEKKFHLLGIGNTSLLQAIQPYSSDSSASTVINAWAQKRLYFNGKIYWFGRRGKKKLSYKQKKVLNFYRIPPQTVLNEEVFSPENTWLRRLVNIRSMLYWGHYIENCFNTKYFQALNDIDAYEETISQYFPQYFKEKTCT